ncbi:MULTISPECIES: hypothetical protein [unclassified Streptomyces]|uniref:hypothetical protein n=1 Tax=unclassified Streptomyces TaxID=2593676 RepID=UPI00381E8550
MLSLGAFPNGDFEVPLPLIDETLSSEDLSFADTVDQAPTTRTWLDAFALCLVSGAVWERDRAIGLLLRGDYAPAIRDGVPYSPLESRSDPAGLAEMDALCGYLTEAHGHLPRDWPSVTLCKPAVEARVEAATRGRARLQADLAHLPERARLPRPHPVRLPRLRDQGPHR